MLNLVPDKNDIFEDIAKLRAARKIWSDLLQTRNGISDEKKLRLRIHVVTAGSCMTYQEPFNNIVRGSVMALAAALGGTQSLGVSGSDEALSIPSDHAHLMSIRIQQILQEETNLAAVADPLGGSYLIENLTDELERRSLEFLEEIEDRGGFIASIADGWLIVAHFCRHRRRWYQAPSYLSVPMAGKYKCLYVCT